MRRNSYSEMLSEDVSTEKKIRLLHAPGQEDHPDRNHVMTDQASQFADELIEIKNKIIAEHSDLLQRNIGESGVKEELRSIIHRHLVAMLKKQRLSPARLLELVNQVVNQLSEYGPITELYYTKGVQDIHIKRFDRVTYRKDGVLYPSSIQFSGPEEVFELAQKLLRENTAEATTSKAVNWRTPIQSGKLKDGGRFTVILDPLSLKGPTVSIRKHRDGFLSERQLVANGTLSQEMSSYLRESVEGRLNQLIIGGGGAGKTEIARLLGTFIPKGLNVDTIEDTDELELYKIHENVRPFETRKTDESDQTMQGNASDILRFGTLRSDIDIAVVGEILEDMMLVVLLEAMSIGQPGSYSTLHGDTPEIALDRAVMMYSAAMPSLSENFIMKKIAGAIDQIITTKRFQQDGKRRISRITQLVGVENGKFILQDIFRYAPDRGHYRTPHQIGERIRLKLFENGVKSKFALEQVDHE